MLELKNISFSYPRGTKLLEDFSIELPKQGIVHLKGSNGSGKTTFLKIVAGLILPQSGTLFMRGAPLTSATCSYMPAQPESLLFHLTGEENIKLFWELNSKEVNLEQLISKLDSLSGFNKALKTRVMFSSTGMKQIINFARVLTKECPILLLDEPFKGLDDESSKIMEALLEELKNQKLILVTGHNDLNLSISKVLQFPLSQENRSTSHA